MFVMDNIFFSFILLKNSIFYKKHFNYFEIEMNRIYLKNINLMEIKEYKNSHRFFEDIYQGFLDIFALEMLLQDQSNRCLKPFNSAMAYL